MAKELDHVVMQLSALEAVDNMNKWLKNDAAPGLRRFDFLYINGMYIITAKYRKVATRISQVAFTDDITKWNFKPQGSKGPIVNDGGVIIYFWETFGGITNAGKRRKKVDKRNTYSS